MRGQWLLSPCFAPTTFMFLLRIACSGEPVSSTSTPPSQAAADPPTYKAALSNEGLLSHPAVCEHLPRCPAAQATYRQDSMGD